MGRKHAEDQARAEAALGHPNWRGPIIRSICAMFALAMWGGAVWVVVENPEPVGWVGAVLLGLIGLDAAVSAWRKSEPILSRIGPLP